MIEILFLLCVTTACSDTEEEKSEELVNDDESETEECSPGYTGSYSMPSYKDFKPPEIYRQPDETKVFEFKFFDSLGRRVIQTNKLEIWH